MTKTKIACVATCVILCAGVAVTAASCGVRNKIKLDPDDGTAIDGSNGGFTAYTEDYIYFINGIQNNGEDNTYGKVEKGALMRISRDDFSNRYYSNVETVVPQIIYTGDYNAGIYIYDGYVYYSTPSTDRNSDGEILNTRLDFKRTKLNGSESMTGRYYQATDSEIEYRYVQPGGAGTDVYLMYVADEDYYDLGTDTTNIHSYNTATGRDTVLAYNIDSYVFDTTNPENPVVYYTMDVTNKIGGDSPTVQDYNQVYRATADMFEPQVYDFSYIDTEDDDYNEDDPIYVNCGDLVFDGIGRLNSVISPTQFNYYGEDEEAYSAEDDKYYLNNANYTYELVKLDDGVLYYNRTSATNPDNTVMFRLDENSEHYDENDASSVKFVEAISNRSYDENHKWTTEWNAITNNASISSANWSNDADVFLYDGESGESYDFITVDGRDAIYGLRSNNSKLILVPVTDGAFDEESEIPLTGDTNEGEPLYHYTVDSVDEAGNECHYMYYSFTGDNDALLYRIDYTGEYKDYTYLPMGDDEGENYDGVKVMDVEFDTYWFEPEIIDDQFIYVSQTGELADYDYLEVCDLRCDEYDENGEFTGHHLMSNAEIRDVNDLYDDVFDNIEDIDEDDYENLQGALKYLFYTGDVDYMEDLVDHWVTYEDKKDTYQFSKESKEIFYAFYNVEDISEGEAADWADWNTKYGDYVKIIDGDLIHPNSVKYYHCLLGVMTEDDEDDYMEVMQEAYMPSDTDDNRAWWDRISMASKVWFIIGMCLCGLVVIAGIVIGCYFLYKYLKKRKAAKEAEEQRRSRKKTRIDVSEIKAEDVYAAGSGEESAAAEDEAEGAEDVAESEKTAEGTAEETESPVEPEPEKTDADAAPAEEIPAETSGDEEKKDDKDV